MNLSTSHFIQLGFRLYSRTDGEGALSVRKLISLQLFPPGELAQLQLVLSDSRSRTLCKVQSALLFFFFTHERDLQHLRNANLCLCLSIQSSHSNTVYNDLITTATFSLTFHKQLFYL